MQRNLNHVHYIVLLKYHKESAELTKIQKVFATCLLKPLFNYDACRWTNCSPTSIMNDKGVG